MKRILLFFSALLTIAMKANAQMVDVTEQYIPNAGFEECDALPIVPYHDNQKNVDIEKIELWSHWNTEKGTDYESQGWKLVEQMKNANGGVVTYGVNIQVGQYATVGEPGPASGVTGTKGLCFTGAAGLVYQQANEITLPAGSYRLTVNLYARNGQTTNPGPTQQVTNVKTGFMPSDGTAEDLMPIAPSKRTSVQFASSAWSQDVLDIELTQPTTGRFQISYGSSYYVVVDDVKLEYQGGIITTALTTVIAKATTLNEQLHSSDLAAAIAAAQDFVASPTAQEDVETQVETLYTAMATALAATTEPVDITAAYLENASFETGKIDPWKWGASAGSVGEPVNEASLPYIDGKYMVEFTTTGSNAIEQTVGHLPAGYYVVDAKLNNKNNMKTRLSINTTTSSLQGGLDPLYLRVNPGVYHADAATDLTIKAQSTYAFRIDHFRLFYGKDEASLMAALLPAVKADAQAVLESSQLGDVTGDERSALLTALEGTDINAINSALNAFVASVSAYEKLAKSKAAAADYTREAYPYGSDELLQQIETLVATDATSAADATTLASQLDELCFSYYVSNAYCEGVERTDYTENILDANATETASRWAAQNMAIRADKTGWLNPKTQETDKVVYGVTTSYYAASANSASILKQTLSGLPAGDYVLSMTMMGSTSLPVHVFFNGELVGTMTAHGTISGGKYGAGWNDYVMAFTKDDDTDMPLQLQCKPDVNYKEWYVDNFRLYRLEKGASDGIATAGTTAASLPTAVYDLQGRRLTPATRKGLVIVRTADGKTVKRIGK